MTREPPFLTQIGKCVQLLSFKRWGSCIICRNYVSLICIQEKHLNFQEKSGKNSRQDACYVGSRQIALEKGFICMTCVHTNNHVKAYPYFDGGQDLMLLES